MWQIIWFTWHHRAQVSSYSTKVQALRWFLSYQEYFSIAIFHNKQIRLTVGPISSKTRWAGPFCLILPAVQNACKECSVYMYSSLLPSYFDTKKSTPSKPLRNFLAQKLGVGVKVELYCLPFRLSEKVSPSNYLLMCLNFGPLHLIEHFIFT